MISYELAKQLKKAGFPLSRHEVDMLPYISQDGKTWYAPTLSELIEECGDELLSIEHIKDEGHDDGRLMWWANAEDDGRAGETIEEAVALLYIALKEREKDNEWNQHVAEMGELGVIVE